VAVELQVTARGPMRDLVAQISGAGRRGGDGGDTRDPARRALTDGVVTADDRTAGLLRLHVRTADGHELVTSWVRTEPSLTLGPESECCRRQAAGGFVATGVCRLDL